MLVSVFLLTLLIALQVKDISFETSSENMLQATNKERLTYLKFKDDYHSGWTFIILIESKQIFSPPFLKKMALLQTDLLNNVPYVDEIESLLTSRRVIGNGENLYFDSLIPDNPTIEDIESSRQLALNTAYYLNYIINPAGDATALIIKMMPSIHDTESGEYRQLMQDDMQLVVEKINTVISHHQPNFDKPLSLTGPAVAAVELMLATRHDVIIFSLVAIMVISCLLALVFRRLSGVILPMFLLSMSISITMSIMLILKEPIQIVSSILPSFLLAVCVCDSVHFLQIFYRKFDTGMPKREAILYAGNHTFVALFFTSLTTAIGLLSFSTSSVAPIANFGIYSALGVTIALLLTYICLPTLLMVSPIKSKKVTIDTTTKYADIIARYVTLLQRWAFEVVITSIVLLIVSTYLVSQLHLSHNPLKWFPEDNKARQAIERVDEKLTGTMPLELLIDTGKDYGVYDPIFLHKLDNWLAQLQQQNIAGVEIKTTASLLDIIKEVNAVLSDTKEYQLPNTKELIAQEILLIEIDAVDQVRAFSDKNFRTLRISISTPWQDAVNYTHFLKEIEISFDKTFDNSISLVMTGVVALGSQITIEMMNSMIESYLIAAVMISLFMMLLLKSIKLGVIMMLPNLLPIMLILGFMAINHIALDMFTLLIGAIAIGIIVDDSIHFIYNFKRAYKKTGCVTSAIETALIDEGQAMLITTLVLCCGFLVYIFSALNNLHTFGLLTALCILLALLADLILAPALILLTEKYKLRRVN